MLPRPRHLRRLQHLYSRSLASTASGRPSLFQAQEEETEIREAVRKLCERYPNDYWRRLDAQSLYPTDFVNDLGQSGFLHALVPIEYGGSGQSLGTACAILEEIHASGGNGGAAHAQMYMLSSILRFGTDEQKQKYLPKFCTNELKFQAFGITESESGSDTLSLRTRATNLNNGKWSIKGRKMWTSRALQSDLMLVLARTSDEGPRSMRFTTFLVDLRDAKEANTVSINKIDAAINHNTCEVYFDDCIVDSNQILGSVGQGFHVILSVLNAERVLIASECIGDGRFFIDRSTQYAKERSVFGRPIGQNQGVQFPLANSFINLESAALATRFAGRLWETNPEKSGPACMAAKHLASEASWQCAEMCMQTLGGIAFAKSFDIERKWREARLFRIAPISTNLILAHIGEKVLGLPKSY